jgi:RNA polymerase sigma factor (sigma-70 family)
MDLHTCSVMQPTTHPRSSFASDEGLVKECLNGNQAAWAALLQKYGKLIYSIPLKFGLSQEDANDIFQQTCFQLLQSLPNLRDFQSLPAWLIKVTTHLCYRWSAKERRFESEQVETDWGRTPEPPDQLLREVEQEQVLREAMASLKRRCRELLCMLFFEIPAVPYATVAKRLGLAAGSIGFIRMRCLRALRRELEERGFDEPRL